MNSRFLIILYLLIISSCDLPVEHIEYIEKPVIFGNLTYGYSKLDTIYVSMSNSIDESHTDDSYWIDNAIVSLNEIALINVEKGRYVNYNILNYQYDSTYIIDVNIEGFSYSTSTTFPPEIDLFDNSIEASQEYHCDNSPIEIAIIDLYPIQNSSDSLYYLLSNLISTKMDTIIYDTTSCYTATWMSVPYAALKWETPGSIEEIGFIRFTSIALNPSAESSIIDTSLSAMAFKGHLEKCIDNDGIALCRSPIMSINLSNQEINLLWLNFNYYGPHLILFEALNTDASTYYAGDPEGINPYLEHDGNFGDEAYGLFSASTMKYFFVYVDSL